MPGNLNEGGRRSAVTLIELLVVASIISLLGTLMMPSLKRAREQAKLTVCLSHLKNNAVGLFSYAEFNREYGPPIMKPLSGKSNRSLIQRRRPDGTVLQHLGYLWPEYVSDARVFRCPSATTLDVGGRLEHLGMPNPVPVAGNYTYAVHIPALISPRLGASRNLAIVVDNFTQYRISQLGHGHYTHKIGYNVLYIDGSASWYSDPDQSIARQRIQWDDERDEFTYQDIYDPNAEIPPDSYGSNMDVFRAWHSFCYNLKDPF